MRRTISRRLLLCAIVATAAIAFPLGVLASHQFSDVPNTNSFHADIDAIADAGVTTGCAPGKYCPKDYVTREQMAAFLNRLGALQAGKPPVVNADKVDGKDEVLGAGPIVTQHIPIWGNARGENARVLGGSALLPYFDIGLGTQTYWFAELSAPVWIDGQGYALSNAAICLVDAGTPFVTRTLVWHLLPAGDATIADDTTNRTDTGCYDIAVDEHSGLGAYQLQLLVDYPQSDGYASIRYVAATWVPVP